jgi:hypothetical protein
LLEVVVEVVEVVEVVAVVEVVGQASIRNTGNSGQMPHCCKRRTSPAEAPLRL